MSNQVYSNTQEKYVPMRGVQVFQTGAELRLGNGTVVAPNTVPVQGTPVFAVTADQGLAYARIDAANSNRLTFDYAGVYSLEFTVPVCGGNGSGAVSTTVDVDALLSLQLNNTGTALDTTVLARTSRREAAPGAGVGAINHYLSLSYTGYFTAGSTIAPLVSNYEPAECLVRAGCVLVVNKLI